MKKKLLSAVLCIVMLLTMIPVTALAATKVVNNLAELQSALDDETVDTIELNYNITIRDNVTLDLKGKTVTSDSAYLRVEKGNVVTEVTICGGTIDVKIENYSTLIIDNTTISGNILNKTGYVMSIQDSTITGNIDNQNGGADPRIYNCIISGNINNSSRLEISDGQISGEITNNGKGTLSIVSTNLEESSKITNSGKLSLVGANAYGSITNTADGEINIEGTNLYFGRGCSFSNSGTAYMSGGNITGGAVTNDSTGTFTITGGFYQYCDISADANTTITGGDFDCDVVNEGTIKGGTFYRKITGAGKIDGLTVTYMIGSTQFARQVVQSGKTAEVPQYLDGDKKTWYSDEACTTPYDFSSAVTENITLYAPYEITVNYELDGGSWSLGASPTTSYLSNETLVLPTDDDVYKRGYTLNSWELTEDSETEKTYTAIWDVGVYDIIYMLNGGTNAAGNPATYTYGVGVETLLPPTKEGYIFVEWRAGDKYGEPVTGISKTEVGRFTLTAMWRQKQEQTAPNAPELESSTENSITLKAIEANENGAAAQYSIDGGATWQDSPEFTELESGTEYTFVARYGETDTCSASPASEEAAFSTESEQEEDTYCSRIVRLIRFIISMLHWFR